MPRVRKLPPKKREVPSRARNVKSIQGWRKVGGRRIYFRSRFEANYGRYLEWLKKRKEILEWEHEPKTFWFEGIRRGCVTYLPDFKVTKLDGSHEWHEVKGYMDSKSKTKLKRFKKYFPSENLVLVNTKCFRETLNCLLGKIKDLES